MKDVPLRSKRADDSHEPLSVEDTHTGLVTCVLLGAAYARDPVKGKRASETADGNLTVSVADLRFITTLTAKEMGATLNHLIKCGAAEMILGEDGHLEMFRAITTKESA